MDELAAAVSATTFSESAVTSGVTLIVLALGNDPCLDGVDGEVLLFFDGDSFSASILLAPLVSIFSSPSTFSSSFFCLSAFSFTGDFRFAAAWQCSDYDIDTKM